MTTIFPPVEPEDLEQSNPNKKKKKHKKVSFRAIAPSLFTLLALCAGLTSIKLAFEGRFDHSVMAVMIAAILDTLDGRVARFLKSTSKFGAELDSLTDFVNFGVAPCIILYAWSLNELKPMGWIIALCFAICVALRLARFNVALDHKKPEWAVDYFIGIPAPAGALLALFPIHAQVSFPNLLTQPFHPVFVLVFTFIVGLFMVSNLPTYSFKRTAQKIRGDFVLPFYMLFTLLTALLVYFPYRFLTISSVIYVVLMLFSYLSYKRLQAKTNVEAKIKDVGK